MNDEKTRTGDNNLDDKSVGAEENRLGKKIHKKQHYSFNMTPAGTEHTHPSYPPGRRPDGHAHGAVTVTATTRETSAREEGRHANNNERGEPRRRDVSIGEADD